MPPENRKRYTINTALSSGLNFNQNNNYSGSVTSASVSNLAAAHGGGEWSNHLAIKEGLTTRNSSFKIPILIKVSNKDALGKKNK